MTMPRKIIIAVTPADVELAKQGDAGFCAVTVSIARRYPKVKSVYVRHSLISMTDPTTRLRYDWPTPNLVNAWIDRWDPTDDKVDFLNDNPLQLELLVSNANVRKMKDKTPQQKYASRKRAEEIAKIKALRTPKQIAQDIEKLNFQRKKSRAS